MENLLNKSDDALRLESEQLKAEAEKLDPMINDQINLFQTFTNESEYLADYFERLNQTPTAVATNHLSV